MTWDHSPETETRVQVTPLAGRRSRLSERRFTESITHGATQVDSEFIWRLWYHHADTRVSYSAISWS